MGLERPRRRRHRRHRRLLQNDPLRSPLPMVVPAAVSARSGGGGGPRSYKAAGPATARCRAFYDHRHDRHDRHALLLLLQLLLRLLLLLLRASRAVASSGQRTSAMVTR